MSSQGPPSPAVERGHVAGPGRWVPWAAIAIADALLLLALARAPLVAAAAVAASVIGWLAVRHPRFALAAVATGYPLLHFLLRLEGELSWVFLGTRVVLGLIVGAALWSHAWQARPRRPAILGDPVLLWSVVLGALVLAGLAWTPSPSYGRSKVIGYLGENLFVLLAAGLLLQPAGADPHGARRRRAGIALLASVAVLQVSIAVSGVHDALFDPHPLRVRLTTLGLNPIWLARHAGMGILAVIALRRLRRIPAWTAFAGLGLLGWTFWAAASRGPVVAILPALLVLAVPADRARRVRIFRPAVLAAASVSAVAATLVVLLLLPQARELVGSFLGGRELSNMVRVRLLQVAADALAGTGALGLGAGGFSQLVRLGDTRFYPHNLFIEVLLEQGILGLIVLVLFLAALLRHWKRWGRALDSGPPDREGSILRSAVGAMLLFAFLNAQFSGDVPVNSWFWLWAGALAALSPVKR